MVTESEIKLSGRGLDAAIAERLFGWEWWERPDDNNGTIRKVLFPPLNSGWLRYNFNPCDWKPAQPSTELFSDWDDCCRRESDHALGLPYFSSDITAAMEAEEKILERGLKYEYGVKLGEVVSDSVSSPTTFDYAHATAEQRCRAMLAAVESK